MGQVNINNNSQDNNEEKIDNTSNNEIDQKVENKKLKSNKKILFNIIFLIIICGVGIWFLFALTNEFNKDNGGIKSLSEAIRDMNGWMFLLAIGVLILYIMTDGLKYYVITKTATGKAKLRISFKAAMLGKFYDNITPSSTGGQPMQIIYLSKKGYSIADSTAIVITRFFVQMFAWVFVGGFFMIAGSSSLLSIADPAGRTTLQVFAWVGLGMILSLPLLTLSFIFFPKLTGAIVRFFLRVGHKLHIVKDKDKMIEKANKGVDDFVNSVKLMCTKPLSFILLIILSLLEPLLTIVLPFFILISFTGDSITLASLFNVMSLYVYAHFSAAVIPTPGNGGAFEVTLAAAFSGISANVSTWVIFAFRFFTFYSYIIIGVVLLFYEFCREIVRTKRNKKQGLA